MAFRMSGSLAKDLDGYTRQTFGADNLHELWTHLTVGSGNVAGGPYARTPKPE